MRLWSIHPRYLDAAGLVAAWREALLAQAVLLGRTRGYTAHPQLIRFRATPNPTAAIARYLEGLATEAAARGYAFDVGKIGRKREATSIEVTSGQLAFEWRHLKAKLRERSPARYREIRGIAMPEPHPSFVVVKGGVAEWERGG